jgi:alkaline phosphatase D
MPLRRSSIPSGPDMRLHRRLQWGQLANLHMLDTRQYRNDQACGDGYKDCPAADNPTRSLLGMAQEQWLAEGFANSNATWDVLGQQVFFSRRDSTTTPDNTVLMDAWDGYRPSRTRVTNSWVQAQVRNPIVLTGDVHAHWASDILADFSAPGSPVVGSEFVCSSVTSGGDGYDEPTGRHPWAANNPHLKFWTNLRGYVNTRITPQAFTVDYRCVPKVTVKGAAAFTRARFVVDDGVRSARQTFNNPSRTRATIAPRSDAEKIRDTIRTESG